MSLAIQIFLLYLIALIQRYYLLTYIRQKAKKILMLKIKQLGKRLK